MNPIAENPQLNQEVDGTVYKEFRELRTAFNRLLQEKNDLQQSYDELAARVEALENPA